VKKLAVVLFVAAVFLTGCGGDTGTVSSSPNPSGENSSDEVVVDISIKDGTVTPQGARVDATVGQKVTLHITSDADEAIHVHSEPEHEYELGPGDDVKKSFTVHTPGVVAVEAHHLDLTIVRVVVRP
jgi:major membrane immunogen (membrane-anchored lipoprotein)